MNLNDIISKLFLTFELIMSDETLIEIKTATKEDLPLFHLGLGVWIRNNLLEEQGNLYKLFISNGIKHKDNMSSKIIESFHEYLQRK